MTDQLQNTIRNIAFKRATDLLPKILTHQEELDRVHTQSKSLASQILLVAPDLTTPEEGAGNRPTRQTTPTGWLFQSNLITKELINLLVVYKTLSRQPEIDPDQAQKEIDACAQEIDRLLVLHYQNDQNRLRSTFMT